MRTWTDFNVETFGWLVFVFAGAVRWWSALYRSEQVAEPARSGPYSVCRNPLQWANLLFCVSLAFFLASVTCALVLAVVATAYFLVSAPVEERKLRAQFGVQYDRYCRAVPRFWPRPWLFRTPENLRIEIGPLMDELRRTAIWMWLPAIGMLLGKG